MVGGEYSIVVDMTTVPEPPGLSHVIVAGETWNFQCWYRDVNPIPTSNFTDGTSIAFQ